MKTILLVEDEALLAENLQRYLTREGYRCLWCDTLAAAEQQWLAADLVLLDLGKPYVVNDSNLLYLCGWSPFNGYRFQSTIEMTLVNGQIAWQNGQVTDQVLGKRLTFNR